MSTEWIEVVSAISKLIPVLGGAAIGVIGGLVGTSYAHKLSRNNDAVKEKVIRLENLVSEVYEIEIWIKKEENYYLYGGQEVLEKSPISKIEAIQSLYFPELRAQALSLSRDALNYRGWLIKSGQLRLSTKSPAAPKECLDELLDFYNPLKASIGNMVVKSKEISEVLNAY